MPDPAPLDPRVIAALTSAQDQGIIGQAPIEAHIAQATAFFAVVAAEASPASNVLDLGSGGGLPGLVVAGRWPTLSLTLLEGRKRRAEALTAVVTALEWTARVRVDPRRAEEAGRDPRARGAFDVVLARGFGGPAPTAECAAPFLRTGGFLVVSDPPGGAAHRWTRPELAILGLEHVRTLDSPFAFSVLRQRAPCPGRYPRRTGVPAHRPLF